ncbi:MAG TPA: SGNH/GDSL hydrolase family protein [Vicinamibacterales bacterium]
MSSAVRPAARLRYLLVVLALVQATLPAQAQNASGDRWVATWATALVARGLPGAGRGQGPGPGGPPPAATTPAPPQPAAAPGTNGAAGAAPGGRAGGPPPPVTVSNQTLRQIVRTSIGGTRLRIVLSNAFGTAPINIAAGDIGLRDGDSGVVTGSVKPLTFGGAPSASILPGAVLVSDAVEMRVPALTDLAVDLYLPGDLGVGPSPVTTHNGASQTNFLSPPGDHTGSPAFLVASRSIAWFLLARVEVAAPPTAGAVVTFGDSITDGARSTPDTNNRWPDHLARRLAAAGQNVAVLNAGISGNRVLSDGAGVSALARFDKDVLMQTGVTHVVVMEGINDIGLARTNPSPGAADLIAAHKQLIDRAKARGLKVYGATLTPFEGAAYWTAEGEAKRQALNEWIRTSRAYDGVIDFDAVTRDPAAPTKFLPAYDSGDHLHPGDAGYKAMGDAVSLALFR